jgi:hypothetical protein
MPTERRAGLAPWRLATAAAGAKMDNISARDSKD